MRLALALLLVLASCEKKQKPAPAPEPTPPVAKCEVSVKVDAGAAPDLSAVKDKSCSVSITGTDKATYQDVITAIDMLGKQGVDDVTIGEAKRAPPSSPELAAQVAADSHAEMKMHGGSAPPNTEALKSAPVIILTTTEAKVGEKVLGKVDDPNLAALLEPELAATTGVVILQADASLGYPIIARVMQALAKAERQVLLAVKPT